MRDSEKDPARPDYLDQLLASRTRALDLVDQLKAKLRDAERERDEARAVLEEQRAWTRKAETERDEALRFRSKELAAVGWVSPEQAAVMRGALDAARDWAEHIDESMVSPANIIRQLDAALEGKP